MFVLETSSFFRVWGPLFVEIFKLGFAGIHPKIKIIFGKSSFWVCVFSSRGYASLFPWTQMKQSGSREEKKCQLSTRIKNYGDRMQSQWGHTSVSSLTHVEQAGVPSESSLEITRPHSIPSQIHRAHIQIIMPTHSFTWLGLIHWAHVDHYWVAHSFDALVWLLSWLVDSIYCFICWLYHYHQELQHLKIVDLTPSSSTLSQLRPPQPNFIEETWFVDVLPVGLSWSHRQSLHFLLLYKPH